MHKVQHSGSAAIWAAFALNFSFALIELVGGSLIASSSVVANGIHDLSDALFVGVSWFLEKKSDQKRDAQYTYGYRRFSLLASLLSGVLLIGGSLLLIASSVIKLFEGGAVAPSQNIFYFIAAGILINGMSYFLIHRRHSHHEKMLSLHFLEDLGGWVFILMGAFITRWTGFIQTDLILSVGLALWIIWRGISQLRTVSQVLLQMSPSAQEPIRHRLQQIPEVQAIHHLHLWSMDGQHHILTFHLVLKHDLPPKTLSLFKSRVRATLKEEFSISDTTFEIELPGEDCEDENCS